MPVSLFLWLRRTAYKDVDCHGCQQSKPIMSPTFEEYGYTVAEVQAMMSVNLHPTILLAFCHGMHTCIFFIALYFISKSFSSLAKESTSHIDILSSREQAAYSETDYPRQHRHILMGRQHYHFEFQLAIYRPSIYCSWNIIGGRAQLLPYR